MSIKVFNIFSHLTDSCASHYIQSPHHINEGDELLKSNAYLRRPKLLFSSLIHESSLRKSLYYPPAEPERVP
jgi:hypothetical protein